MRIASSDLRFISMRKCLRLIEQLWVRIGPCMNYLHQELNDIKASTYHYDELLSALERRDVVACQKAIDKVIDEANLLLQRQYFN